MTEPPRSTAQRRQDTLTRLTGDADIWVATADPATGAPYLTPLSFLWDGESVLLATPANSPTGTNLEASRRVRLGLGATRDVTMIDGTVADVIPAADIAAGVADAFIAATGFDPRDEPGAYCYYRITPTRMQAWREANELAGRTLMLGGEWQ